MNRKGSPGTATTKAKNNTSQVVAVTDVLGSTAIATIVMPEPKKNRAAKDDNIMRPKAAHRWHSMAATPIMNAAMEKAENASN